MLRRLIFWNRSGMLESAFFLSFFIFLLLLSLQSQNRASYISNYENEFIYNFSLSHLSYRIEWFEINNIFFYLFVVLRFEFSVASLIFGEKWVNNDGNCKMELLKKANNSTFYLPSSINGFHMRFGENWKRTGSWVVGFSTWEFVGLKTR